MQAEISPAVTSQVYGLQALSTKTVSSTPPTVGATNVAALPDWSWHIMTAAAPEAPGVHELVTSRAVTSVGPLSWPVVSPRVALTSVGHTSARSTGNWSSTFWSL